MHIDVANSDWMFGWWFSTVPLSGVADPGCLSRIPDPDFYPSRIPDPKTATKERGEKNLLSCHFLWPQISQYLKLFFCRNILTKIIWANFQRIVDLFYLKNCQKALNNMGLGFDIRDPKKTYPGSRGQKGTGSRIRIRNTASESSRLPHSSSHSMSGTNGETDPCIGFGTDLNPVPDPYLVIWRPKM